MQEVVLRFLSLGDSILLYNIRVVGIIFKMQHIPMRSMTI